MKRTLVCNYLPQQYLRKLKASQAANNFCYRLFTGNCFDDVRSILPVSYYIPEKLQDANVHFYQVARKNKILSLLYYLILSLKLCWDVKKSKSIWFYNIVPSNVLSFIFLTYVMRKNTFVILADYTPSTRKWSLQSLIGKLLEHSQGMISLSDRTVYGNKKHFRVIAGVIDKSLFNFSRPEQKPKDHPIFLFSGTLSKVTGFEMALKVFAKVPKATLYISGNGVLPEEYSKFSNIHFCGNMPYSDYLNLLESATVCLNLRDPQLPENCNNFPSKVLDYMTMGKIVLSTMKYPEIEGTYYVYCPFSESDLAGTIETIATGGVASLCAHSNMDFLKEHFSPEAWSSTMEEIESK